MSAQQNIYSDIAARIKKKGYAKERIRADSSEPKSNEDLRRMGISRITPAVKGPDSILSGIARISEYRITVEPSCTGAISELSSYRYSQKCNQKGQRIPEDSNNHLIDALRYAFEDVKYFKEESTQNSRYSCSAVLLKKWK